MKLPLILALVGASALASVAVAAPAEDSSKDAKQPMVLSSTQMDVVTAGGNHSPQTVTVRDTGRTASVAARALDTAASEYALFAQ